MLTYRLGRHLSVVQFRDLLNRSTLGERRPVNDIDCLRGMLDNANLLVTCFDGEQAVGVARSVTDFSYCCYLSDLAVDVDYQGRGIGKTLIEQTRQQLGDRCRLILLAAPAAATYYPHLGFERHESAWTLPPAGSA